MGSENLNWGIKKASVTGVESKVGPGVEQDQILQSFQAKIDVTFIQRMGGKLLNHFNYRADNMTVSKDFSDSRMETE